MWLHFSYLPSQQFFLCPNFFLTITLVPSQTAQNICTSCIYARQKLAELGKNWEKWAKIGKSKIKNGEMTLRHQICQFYSPNSVWYLKFCIIGRLTVPYPPTKFQQNHSRESLFKLFCRFGFSNSKGLKDWAYIRSRSSAHRNNWNKWANPPPPTPNNSL